MNPDKTVFVVRPEVQDKLAGALLLQNGIWADKKQWRISDNTTLLGVPFTIGGDGGLRLPLEDLREVMRRRVLDPLEVLGQMAESTPPGDALFLLKRYVLPKLDHLAGVYGLEPRAHEVWVEADDALDRFLKIAVPEHCWNTNPGLRLEISLPPRDGGWGIKEYRFYAA